MKKHFSAALLFVCSLFFCGLQAAEVNVNGVFKGANEGGKNSPRWILRADSTGKIEFVKGEKAPLALKVTAGVKKISCISKVKIPCKSGDKLILSCNSKGKGTFQFSTFFYNGRKSVSTLHGKKLVLTEKSTQYSQEFTVPAKGEKTHMVMVIVAHPSTVITLEDVKAQHEAAK